MVYCRNCGAMIDEREYCCPNCGAGQYAMPNYNDDGSFWWAVLGFFVPLAGLVLYLVWRNERPKTADMVGKGALVCAIVSAVMTIISFVLSFSFIIGFSIFLNAIV